MIRTGILFTAMAGLLIAHPLRAQDAIRPAAEIRVIEMAAGQSVTRRVVHDLSPAEILRLQVALARAGHDPRSRSGMLDEPTVRALSAFQARRGLVVCGCVSYEMIVALQIAPRLVGRLESERPVGSTVIVDRQVHVYVATPGYYGGTTVYDSYGVYGGYRGATYGVYGSRRSVHVGPGVVVGHEPAVGAGQLRHHRFPHRGPFPGSRPAISRPERRSVAPPAPPQPGGTLRAGPRVQRP